MDGISWRIIQEDILNGLKQLAAGQEIELAKKTASYQQWADALYEYAQTDQLQEQVPFGKISSVKRKRVLLFKHLRFSI